MIERTINIDGIHYSKSQIEVLDIQQIKTFCSFLETKRDLTLVKSWHPSEYVSVYIDSLIWSLGL